MLRSLKKIRNSFVDAQKNRSYGNSSDDSNDNNNDDSIYNDFFTDRSNALETNASNNYITPPSTTTSSSTTTAAATGIGLPLRRNISQSSTATSSIGSSTNGGNTVGGGGVSYMNATTTTVATVTPSSSYKPTQKKKKATTSFLSATTSSKSRNNNNNNNASDIPTIDKATLLSKSQYLSSFDKCIEASDTMIASSYGITSTPSTTTTKSSSSTTDDDNTNNNNNNNYYERTESDTIFATRYDIPTGLPDCSLLVSPDGDLLLVPNEQKNICAMFQSTTNSSSSSSTAMKQKQLQLQQKNQILQQKQEESKTISKDDDSSNHTTTSKLADTDVDIDDDGDDDDIGLNRNETNTSIVQTDYTTTSSHVDGLGSFSELMRQSKEDYESAMFIGNDLHGDKLVNRFTARGWSVPATTLAVQQTEYALQSMVQFCEQYVLARKACAAQMTIACDQWRNEFDQRRGFQPNKKHEIPMTGEQWEILEPRALTFEISPSRVGPFTSHGSTLHAATMAIEQYHHEAAEKESHRWRTATIQRNNSNTNGVLPAIQNAYETYRIRSTKRQQALSDMSHRAKVVEEHIRKLKQLSEQKWDIVYKAEHRVTAKMEELMSERSKEKQKARLKQLLHQQQQQYAFDNSSSYSTTHPNTPQSTTTTSQNNIDDIQLTCNLSEEVWDMVSSVAESMEHGSFEPIPDATSTISDEGGTGIIGSQSQYNSNNTNSDEVLVSHPIITREEIEQEMGVPELRRAARQVDDEIVDESGTLLNILSLLDTTRRSARIAAETCLVSAGNAQVKCLRSMLQLERESLQERLRDLDGLEHVLDKVDIRADLDAYIQADKKEVGGCSHLGEDDDGGIASALAVLSSHVDGIIMGQESHHSTSTTTRQHTISSTSDNHDGPDNNTEIDVIDDVTTNMLNFAIDKVFQEHTALSIDDTNKLDDVGKKYCTEFDENVDFICRSITGNTTKAQKLRSSLCYLLNSKRGTYAQILTMKQYNAIGKIFSTILTNGMNDAEIGISNAKMCMMLAQTFYYLSDDEPSKTSAPPTPSPSENVVVPFIHDKGSVGEKSTVVDTPTTLDITKQDVNSSFTSFSSTNSNSDRQYRLYIKNALVDHPIWAKDDFWDVALSQQISESLTHSGVMSNFDARRIRASRVKSHEKHSSMTQWYDLNYVERVEAASQVHAVVFAQLGALAHSMIEFNCGLERSCAFVRRMSIRNQLPSSQRTMLLLHLIQRDDVGRRESKT